MAQPSRWLHRILLLLLTLVILLCVLEIGSRLILGPPPSLALASIEDVPRDRGSLGTYHVEVTNAPDAGLYHHTVGGLRLIPDMKAVIRNHRLNGRDILIESNSLGLRHRELGPKKNNELRILVLGDSITFADYVDDDETFVRVLERRIIDDQPTDRPVQVINAGVGAINLQTEYLILKEKVSAVEPDLVVVALYLNDASTSPVIKPLSYPFRLSQFLQWTQLKSFNLMRRWDGSRNAEDRQWIEEFERSNGPEQGDWRLEPRALDQEILKAAGDWGYAWSDRAWSKMKPVFVELNRFAGQHGFETVVMLLPVRQQVESGFVNDVPQKKFDHLLTELRLPHFEVLGDLRDDWQQRQEALFYDHCHLTPHGNRVVASTMHEFLKGEGFVD